MSDDLCDFLNKLITCFVPRKRYESPQFVNQSTDIINKNITPSVTLLNVL